MESSLLIFGMVLMTGLLCVAEPIAMARNSPGRVRRQAAVDVDPMRNCSADPPYVPELTVTNTSQRLEDIRVLMSNLTLQAYLVPSEDAHGSEYVPPHDERRAYISGFKGSAGLAIVTSDTAVVWVDGRYFTQVKQEIDCNWDWLRSGDYGDPSPEEYLANKLTDGQNVGFDPTLISLSGYNSYVDEFSKNTTRTINMVDIEANLVDQVWGADQPPYNPDTVITVLDAETYTGETWQEKVKTGLPDQSSIIQQLDEGVNALIISKLDEIAWLFNLRGQDVPYNPMFVSYAIVTRTTTTLYLYNSTSDVRVPSAVKTHLNVNSAGTACSSGADCVLVKDYDDFPGDLTLLLTTVEDMIWIPDESNYAIYAAIPEARRYEAASPLLLMKAVKSETEALGMERAHLMDSVALCNLGAWMQNTINGFADPSKGDISVLSEQTVMTKAEELRRVFPSNSGLSFGTIAGFGEHGAIIHYTSTPDTDVAITNGGTFLLDSGGQYFEGTCDITRTFHFGTPTAFEKEAYTRVLLGSIDLAQSVFRDNIYGRDIDAIARNQLWSGGLDYNHGTGHGIGHFLNVHEGPARIRIGVREGEKPLQRDMFLSDGPINIADYDGERPLQRDVFNSIEPGYYEEGSFGIRIENIVRTVPATVEHDFLNYNYTTFKMISLVPFEPSLTDLTMFTNKQLDYLNAYNLRIRDEVGSQPELTAEGRSWMMSKTEPIQFNFNFDTGGARDGRRLSVSSIMVLVGALFGAMFL